MRLAYLSNVTTLAFDEHKCTSCRTCVDVCPHAVFSVQGNRVFVRDKNACMECGACARNCSSQAITVDAGVGCAAAVIFGWLTNSEPSCDC